MISGWRIGLTSDVCSLHPCTVRTAMWDQYCSSTRAQRANLSHNLSCTNTAHSRCFTDSWRHDRTRNCWDEAATERRNRETADFIVVRTGIAADIELETNRNYVTFYRRFGISLFTAGFYQRLAGTNSNGNVAKEPVYSLSLLIVQSARHTRIAIPIHGVPEHLLTVPGTSLGDSRWSGTGQ